ncbi:ANTAR domain-containing protein [Streptomyces sp. MMBL 11-3]|uniref:ANTAR domain-containing protein n=1 Tax=Streptomyces sp. MMBL 11-3 TaxID=3382639 RepID=UPI0039B6B1C8
MMREEQLAEAFVGLADTLDEGFDPVVLLDRLTGYCVGIVGADTAGIVMATIRGDLRTMAVSAGPAPAELIRTQTEEGPGLDCYETHLPVDARRLHGWADRWPRFTARALEAGYGAAHALPLRVGRQTVGFVSLLLTAPDGLAPGDLRLAQALADVAAVALVHWSPDPARPMDILTHVQAAVAAKATVEMAQGMLAEHGGLDPAHALEALRAYSGRNGNRLTATA